MSTNSSTTTTESSSRLKGTQSLRRGGKRSEPGLLEEDSEMSAKRSKTIITGQSDYLPERTPNLPSPEPEIFTRRWDPVRENWAFDVNEKMSTKERREISCKMHIEVQQTHLLSNTQLEATGLFEPQPNTLTYLNTKRGGVPGFGEVTADILKEWGYLDQLLALRKTFLHIEYQQMLQRVSMRANSKFEGTAYQAGLTFQPHYGPSCCQIGAVSRSEDETEMKKCLQKLMQICSEVQDRFMPELNESSRDKRKLAKASLIPFSRGNPHFTSAQCNYTQPKEDLSKLRKFGALHPDKNDYPYAMTALVNFSHAPPNFSQGRLNLTPFKTVIPLRSLSIYFFSARYFHCSTGHGFYSVPEGSPLRLPIPSLDLIPAIEPLEQYPYQRLTIPVYTDIRLMEPRFHYFHPEIYNWEDGGNKIFTDQLEHRNWLMNHWIVHEPEIRSRIAARKWSLLRRSLQCKADGRDESTWASRIHGNDPGSGPGQLCYAQLTCESYKLKVGEEVKSNMVRNGNVDHYLSLFSWIDTETGTRMYPDRQLAVDILEAINSPNEKFDEMEQDYGELYCGTTFINKKGTSEEEKEGGVKWLTMSELKWDSKKDRIPANPGWEGVKDGVTLEQLYAAEDLASVGDKLAAVAADMAADFRPV